MPMDYTLSSMVCLTLFFSVLTVNVEMSYYTEGYWLLCPKVLEAFMN